MGLRISILEARAANKAWALDMGTFLEKVVPSEVPQELKFSSQYSVNQEFEAGTSNNIILMAKKLQSKTSPCKRLPTCMAWKNKFVHVSFG